MLITIILLIILVAGFSIYVASHSYKFEKETNKYTPAKYGFEFEEMSIPTKNDKRLYGWWIPAGNPSDEELPTIILVHGWARNVDRMMSYIKQLHPAGYNLLAFDSRCHGQSDDDKFSSMPKYTEDIQAAIAYSLKLPNVDENRIGLLGLSMGGAASIYAASMDNRIRAVATVGAFSHPEKVMGLELRKHKIPNPIVWLIFRYMEIRIGRRFSQIAPSNNIAKSDAKFLLIHGINDETVPLEQGKELYDSSLQSNTTLWEVDGKGHSDCNHHPEFWLKVLEFYEVNL